MSANKKLPPRHHPLAEPIDIETDAPGLVDALISIKKTCLDPYIDYDAITDKLDSFKIDIKYIPDEIIEELVLYQQYLHLCLQLDDEKRFIFNCLLRSTCTAFFKHGYNMALDADANEFSHFIP